MNPNRQKSHSINMNQIRGMIIMLIIKIIVNHGRTECALITYNKEVSALKKFLLFAAAAALSAAAFVIIRNLIPETDEPEEVFVSAETADERMDYFSSHGWEVSEISCRDIVIPEKFSREYEEYALMQDRQGLPLRRYMGRNGRLFVYEVKNYSPENKKMLAELIVCDGIAAASMVYSEDGGKLRFPVQ